MFNLFKKRDYPRCGKCMKEIKKEMSYCFLELQPLPFCKKCWDIVSNDEEVRKMIEDLNNKLKK